MGEEWVGWPARGGDGGPALHALPGDCDLAETVRGGSSLLVEGADGQVVLRAPPLSPPWACWARRHAGALGMDVAAADRVALVIALVTSEAREADALGGLALGRRLLLPLVDASRLDAWLVSLCDVPGPRRHDNPRVGPASIGATSVLFERGQRAAAAAWTVAPLVAGRSPSRWMPFARKLAPVVGLVEALAGLWLDDAQEDLARNRLDGGLARAAGGLGELLCAWAGGSELEDRARRVRRALTEQARREGVRRAFESGRRDAEASAPEEGRELTEELLEGLGRAFDWLDSYGVVWSLGRELIGSAPHEVELDGLVDGSLRIATEYLVATESWESSWEVRRRGLAGSTELLVGSWFHRGFVLRALARCGVPRSESISLLLAEDHPEGLRWFGESRCIPPDADSLGLALDLGAMEGVRVEPERLEEWIAPLRESLGTEGIIPTWFYGGPEGATLDDPEWLFRGEACTAVRLAAMIGLLRHDTPRFGGLVEQNLRALLEGSRRSGLDGVAFYPAAYGDWLLARLGGIFRGALPTSELLPSLDSALGDVLDRTRGGQRLDGSWGGAQETGYRLATLAALGGDPSDLERGARFLVETQRPDGSWAAEPFYLMPGLGDAPAWHLGPALTTAVCAEALHAARGA